MPFLLLHARISGAAQKRVYMPQYLYVARVGLNESNYIQPISLEMVIVDQPVKKLVFYGIRRFITMFTEFR
jgi:hypothetical protein